MLGIAVFAVFVPMVPMSRDSCVGPGCGGPEYGSITYSTVGVGWYFVFVSPDAAQYDWIAPAAWISFCAIVGYAVLLIFRRVHGSPFSPQI
ncbi:MAG: hypothetical protein AUF79_04075 [Crenarchaeota archaeon 13_1_20CM_2_51_8]|nr:MAG: hypothetical protein AUF79_04075 [Crenarchaeota archaeon 13_1_20CM_2_51_8]